MKVKIQAFIHLLRYCEPEAKQNAAAQSFIFAIATDHPEGQMHQCREVNPLAAQEVTKKGSGVEGREEGGLDAEYMVMVTLTVQPDWIKRPLKSQQSHGGLHLQLSGLLVGEALFGEVRACSCAFGRHIPHWHPSPELCSLPLRTGVGFPLLLFWPQPT